MRIRQIHVANYKAYRAPATLEVRPLTVLIGRNHAGKSALLRAVPLIAHSLRIQENPDRGPIVLDDHDETGMTLPLKAGGLWHGGLFGQKLNDQPRFG